MAAEHPGRARKTAAALFTLLFLAILAIPVGLLTETMIEGIQTLIGQIKAGGLSIPPPPDSVGTWPIIGAPLHNLWNTASTNLTGLLKSLTPQIKALVPWLLSASAGIGLTVLQFVLSILVAGVLLAKASGCATVTHSLANRLFGDQGPEFEDLAGSTIRSVTNGILGVAVIQSILAGLGFLVVGLPGAGLWTLIFLFFSRTSGRNPPTCSRRRLRVCDRQHDKGGAVSGLVYRRRFDGQRAETYSVGTRRSCSHSGRLSGSDRQIMALGIIGLFVGAIVLSVGYKLFLAWLEGPRTAKLDS